MRGLPALSVIVPAWNEAQWLPHTLAALQQALADVDRRTEIIVVDNASTDSTPQIAQQAGCRVVFEPERRISRARNAGARAARGRVLLFLDADVTLGQDWRTHLPRALARLSGPEPVVTGSLCVPPATDGSWIERHWFENKAQRVRDDTTYLGTAHMLVRRDVFLELGGFDESLRTGEDFDLCRRARRRGGKVAPVPALRAVHRGFPRSIRAFVRREAWHGSGDTGTWRAIGRSKVALATLAFLGAHLLMAFGLVFLGPVAVAFGGASLMGVLLLSCLGRSRGTPAASLPFTLALYYFYFVGRTLSFLPRPPARPARAGEVITGASFAGGDPRAPRRRRRSFGRVSRIQWRARRPSGSRERSSRRARGRPSRRAYRE